jgi:dihydropteroate synthase
MGILNVTPDSFSDGGRFFSADLAMAQGERLIREGADFLDVGGESTRPFAEPVSIAEEIRRVVPVIEALARQTAVPVSIDTTKSEVARAALAAGASMINDVSAFRLDPALAGLAAEAGVPVILMHMKGVPKTMQSNPFYEDLFQEIRCFLEERIATAAAYGIPREKIIVDPGIGFGKSVEHNLSIINNLHFLESLDRPILLGISRKSFIGKILNLPPQERTEGTIASAVLSVLRGAHIVRVHDVQQVKRAVTVAEAILNENLVSGSGESPEKEKGIRYA